MNYHRDEDYIKNESLFRNIFKKRFDLITKYVERGKVLEIGCSNGIFLSLFKEAGFETWGVEPSGSADEAKKKADKVIKSSFENAELPENYFGLVILNHTLEHMDNPFKILKKVYGLLKKDGIVFVDVPNAGGLGAKFLGKHWPLRLPQEHKWQFTPSDAASLFKKSGFKVIHFESRSGIFEYANPLLELKRPRFLFDLLATPYSLLATILNMGDSMSLIGKKLG